MAEPDLIGTAEAMALLGIDRSTVSRWVKEGRMTPALKLAGATGAFLFRLSDVELLRSALADGEPSKAVG